jgi:hypothetical protein
MGLSFGAQMLHQDREPKANEDEATGNVRGDRPKAWWSAISTALLALPRAKLAPEEPRRVGNWQPARRNVLPG